QGVHAGLAGLFVFQQEIGDTAIGGDHENALVETVTLTRAHQDVVTDVAVLAHAGAADLLDGVLGLGRHCWSSPVIVKVPSRGWSHQGCWVREGSDRGWLFTALALVVLVVHKNWIVSSMVWVGVLRRHGVGIEPGGDDLRS